MTEDSEANAMIEAAKKGIEDPDKCNESITENIKKFVIDRPLKSTTVFVGCLSKFPSLDTSKC